MLWLHLWLRSYISTQWYFSSITLFVYLFEFISIAEWSYSKLFRATSKTYKSDLRNTWCINTFDFYANLWDVYTYDLCYILGLWLDLILLLFLLIKNWQYYKTKTKRTLCHCRIEIQCNVFKTELCDHYLLSSSVLPASPLEYILLRFNFWNGIVEYL